ncbi:(2Fe-2S)-binding protein [Variovorax sp. RT4R15]|uniref:(2Fe-2S)-binding protein n=1 Tax=Variovorax sp. RT4R15 TaxID=3443737 RepID=UPI003F483218
MPTNARFRPLFPIDASPRGESTVSLGFDGRAIEAPVGCSVAAALLVNGVSTFRTTPVSGAPRAPYCMMGACFDCLVEIDGQPNRQSCLVTVAEGMQVKTQAGLRSLDDVGDVASAKAAHVE